MSDSELEKKYQVLMEKIKKIEKHKKWWKIILEHWHIKLFVIIILIITGYGFWNIAGCVNTNDSLDSPQAAVLIFLIIVWGALVITALNVFFKQDEP